MFGEHQLFSIHFALRVALNSDNVAYVSRILTSSPGVDPEQCLEGGVSPLHYSCGVGAMNCLRFFIDSYQINLNSKAAAHRLTPVLHAALYGQGEILRHLHDLQADFSVVDDFGENAIHKAVIRGDLSLLKLLIEDFELYPLLLKTNRQGETPCSMLHGLSSRSIHQKQLTEDSDNQVLLSSVQMYLLDQTARVRRWTARKSLLLMRRLLD
jgi:ankyrin repeat protein